MRSQDDLLSEAMGYSSNLSGIDLKSGEGSSSVDLVQKGYSGIDIVGGNIDWEYNSKITNLNRRMTLWKEMRYNDGSVNCALNLLELPLIGQSAWIEPASTSPEDIMYADFVSDQLVENTNISASYTLLDHTIEAVKAYQYGFMPFEIIFEKGDWHADDGVHKNMVLCKKLLSLHPTSIDRWITDEKDGSVTGLIQTTPSGFEYKGKTSQPEIPMENMAIYVNNKVGDNWEGVSILRSIYKHWSYKDGLYKVEAIGLEKNAMTIPVLYMRNATDERIEKAQKLIRNVLVHEEAGYVLNMDREKLETFTGGISTVAIHRAIAHHDSKILQTVLAGFMLLGQESRGGGRALGSSLIEFFMMSLDSKLRYSKQIKNRYIVRKLVDANFSNVVRYPKFEAYAGRISDKKTMSEILGNLAGKSLVDVDGSLKHYVRSVFGLPTADVVRDGAGVEEGKPIEEQGVNDDSELSIRRLLPAVANTEKLNKFRDKWLFMTRRLVDRQKEELSKQASTWIKKGVVPNISYLSTPYQEEYGALILDYVTVMESEYPRFKQDFSKIVGHVTSLHDMEVRCSISESLLSISDNLRK